MNSISQGNAIVISGANDDAGVQGRESGKADEMPAVVGENGPALGHREGQDREIRYSLLRLTGLLGRQNVMTEPPKLCDHGVIKILVGIQLRLAILRLGIRLDGLVDFLAMTFIVFPGSLQIGAAQVWVMFQKAFVGQTKLPPFH